MDLIEHAKWTLERQLNWIAAAEVKIGFVISLDLAMLAALGAVYANVESPSPGLGILLLATTALLICSVLSAICTFKPTLSGPERSLIFFGKIASMTQQEFKDVFIKQTEIDRLEDHVFQIHRNAEIALIKHKGVTNSIRWGVLALPLWTSSVFIAALSR